jgi:hypothetical protein
MEVKWQMKFGTQYISEQGHFVHGLSFVVISLVSQYIIGLCMTLLLIFLSLK